MAGRPTECDHASICRFVMLALSMLGAAPAWSQIIARNTIDELYVLASDRVDNPTSQTLSVPVGTVCVPGATWVRLHIGGHQLGNQSYLTLTALDGQEQRMDANAIANWYQWSAFFTGDQVDVTLHVAPGDMAAHVEIDRVASPVLSDQAVSADRAFATICNNFDDRVASNDPRVGRMRKWNLGPPGSLNTDASCTAWLVSNGAVLTAGHCIRNGGIPAGSVIEFNVPASLPNGTNVPAAVIDQYPIDVVTIGYEDNGRGEDWMVFRLNPNGGRTAHIVQGFFRMTKLTPNAGTTLRVTGFGLDNIPAGPGGAFCLGGINQGASCMSNVNCPGGGCASAAGCDSDGDGSLEFNCNARSQTQQSTIGPMDDLDGDIIEHDVDTMPSNSGSPIFVEGSDYAFGIHTQGGCDDFLDGFNNHGTHLHRGALEAAIQNFLGPKTKYVDWADVGLPSNGSVYEPLHSVASAVGAVVDGGTIALVAGSYPRTAGNTFVAGADGKAMTFVAPVGAVIIGN